MCKWATLSRDHRQYRTSAKQACSRGHTVHTCFVLLLGTDEPWPQKNCWVGQFLVRYFPLLNLRVPLCTGSWYNSSNGGDTFGTPWTLNAQGTGGGPKIEWPKNRLSAGSLPCVWCGCRREGTLPSCVIKQNTDDRAASVGRRAVAGRSGRWCNQLLGGAKKNRGVLFLWGIGRVSRALSIWPAVSRRGLQPPPETNMDNACTDA